MDDALIPADDGSHIYLVGLTEPEEPDEPDADAPLTLGPIGDFVQQVLFDGAFIGVIGNLSFATLVAIAHRLRSNRMLSTGNAAPDIDEIRARVAAAAGRAGHPAPVFTEITKVADQGWDIRGTVGTAHLMARTDPGGQVIHLRVE